jgi:hypothetical protein
MARNKENGLIETARLRFAQIFNPEVEFEQFTELARQEQQRLQSLSAGNTETYKPGLPGMTPCGGGDFEKGIDPNEWQGAYGQLLTASPPFTGPDPFANFTAGIFPDALTALDPDPTKGGNGHQTPVGAGSDPVTGISLTAPGSAGAARIGNAVNQFGVDVLSKTFTVTAATKNIRFWYALVLQNPAGHAPAIQPFFQVRVTDTALKTIIPGAVDLGNGSDTAVADQTNPFFVSIKDPTLPSASQGEPDPIVVYRDWTCAQINLAAHVGKQVTVEFITADCGAGGHWGYAYVDNFCGSCAGSPSGDFNFNAATSSKCGPGKLCYDYTLPKVTDKKGVVTTGTVTVTLEIFQNGVSVALMTSPPLTSGTSYCFDIDPAAVAGLDLTAEGFDLVATGNFEIAGKALAPLSVGAAPDGVREGTNNDYRIVCNAFSYAVKFVCGVQGDCKCDCGPVLPGRYATEINIYNHGEEPADIVKYVVPVVFGGAPAGREPRTVVARAEDRMTLPPYSATMEDCCRLSELLLGAVAGGPALLNIGYLEIVSPVELTVTAVYTASGPEGDSVSIDVERIEAKPRRAPRPS